MLHSEVVRREKLFENRSFISGLGVVEKNVNTERNIIYIFSSV
jgi:hypothetical protein